MGLEAIQTAIPLGLIRGQPVGYDPQVVRLQFVQAAPSLSAHGHQPRAYQNVDVFGDALSGDREGVCELRDGERALDSQSVEEFTSLWVGQCIEDSIHGP